MTKKLRSSDDFDCSWPKLLCELTLLGTCLTKGFVKDFFKSQSYRIRLFEEASSTNVRIQHYETGEIIGRLHETSISMIRPLLSCSHLCELQVELMQISDKFIVMDDLLMMCKVLVFEELFLMGGGGNLIQNLGLTPISAYKESVKRNIKMVDDGELSNELNLLYEKNGKDSNLAESEPSESFKFKLHPYQKKGLTWLIQKENGDETSSSNMAPFWERYQFPASKEIFYWNPYTGQLSMEFPKAHVNCLGGILADEMGLGKTIEMLALVHSNTPKSQVECNSTLVIAPVTLLSQWYEEAIKSSNVALNLLKFYGTSRLKDTNSLKDADIVFTTFGTLSAEYSAGNSPLFSVKWHRVVVDEAHNIKNASTSIAKSCFALNSKKKWAVTGTPIQNSLEDLYSLLKFLNYEPWCDHPVWKKHVSAVFARRDVKCIETMQTILNPVFLRRTREMKDEFGNSILSLPSREVVLEFIGLNEEERKLYDAVHFKSKAEFDELVKAGTALSQYMHIFQLIAKLRQICDHVFLPTWTKSHAKTEIDKILHDFVKMHQNTDLEMFASQVAAKVKKENSVEFDECPICFEPMELPTLTLCGHLCCYECLVDFLDKFGDLRGECPVCRKAPLTVQDLKPLRKQGKTDDNRKKLLENWKSSSKLDCLLSKIQSMMQDDKAVVFSQWTGMLEIIEIMLSMHKIRFVKMDGTHSQPEREKIINQFRNDKEIKIFLASLKTGGVGLNLTMANVVFLMDPWWNFAVENQAIDRVYRIGQEKPVKVFRFIVENSIEEKMLILQKKKKNLIQSVLEEGTIDKNSRIEDLQVLFR